MSLIQSHKNSQIKIENKLIQNSNKVQNLVQIGIISSVHTSLQTKFSLNILGKPIKHVQMRLFSTFDSCLIINIVPYCPSMSYTREYFHVAVKLKDINSMRVKKNIAELSISRNCKSLHFCYGNKK